MLLGEVFGEESEVGLEFQFVEVEFGSFEKAIFEVVEVEEHAIYVELGLWIAYGPVEPAGSAHLDVGQLADDGCEKLFFVLIVPSSRLSSATQGFKEGGMSEVGLEVSQFVVAHG